MEEVLDDLVGDGIRSQYKKWQTKCTNCSATVNWADGEEKSYYNYHAQKGNNVGVPPVPLVGLDWSRCDSRNILGMIVDRNESGTVL